MGNGAAWKITPLTAQVWLSPAPQPRGTVLILLGIADRKHLPPYPL